MRLARRKATVLSVFVSAIILVSIYFLDCQSSQSSNVMSTGPDVPQIDRHVIVNDFPSYDRITNGMSAKEVFKILGQPTGGCDLHFSSGVNDEEECRTSFHWNLCVKKDMNIRFLHAFITVVQKNATSSSWKSILTSDAEGWANLCMDTLRCPDLDQLANKYFEHYKKLSLVKLFQPLLDRLNIAQNGSSNIETSIPSQIQKPVTRGVDGGDPSLLRFKEKANDPNGNCSIVEERKLVRHCADLSGK